MPGTEGPKTVPRRQSPDRCLQPPAAVGALWAGHAVGWLELILALSTAKATVSPQPFCSPHMLPQETFQEQ